MYIAGPGQQYHKSIKARWWMLTLNNPGVVGIESLHKQLCSNFSPVKKCGLLGIARYR
jgi:hypothetical protein